MNLGTYFILLFLTTTPLLRYTTTIIWKTGSYGWVGGKYIGPEPQGFYYHSYLPLRITALVGKDH